MADDGDWAVSDLLDPDVPFVNDVKLARQMLETLESLDSLQREYTENPAFGSSGLSLEVRTPKAALQFVENTLSDWFDIVAEIEKKKGHLPYLIDRSLYPKGEIKWNQGLTREDLIGWYGDGDTGPRGEHKMWLEWRKVPSVANTGEPLSGYYNRLLPVKFVLRMLAIMVFNSEDWEIEDGFGEDGEADISFSEFRNKACKSAEYAREHLVFEEKKHGFDRGEGISIGFPSESKKSHERFVSQFIGSKRKNVLSGALFEMGFANLGGMLGFHNDTLYFTKEGFYFAMLGNPVIDEKKEWEKGSRFSEDERNFLLLHFKKNIPAEWEFMLQIANMIREGKNRSTPMLAELIKTREWDRAKASIMRTGVIARMQELGLVDRERSGVDITYVLTKSGNKLLVE